MRALAKQIITDAAVSAGMAAESVMDKPEKQNILLPMPRLELEYMPEELGRRYARIAKRDKEPALPDDPVTHRIVRSRLYRRELTVRATIRSDDETWLAQFVDDFIVALPVKTADGDNNLVTVMAARAVRGGFGYRMVEAFVKRSNAVHIVFAGMIAKDEEIPLIRDVNLKDNVGYKTEGA
jgi:hypothetical protein